MFAERCAYVLHDYLLIVDEQKMKSHVYHVENIRNLWGIEGEMFKCDF